MPNDDSNSKELYLAFARIKTARNALAQRLAQLAGDPSPLRGPNKRRDPSSASAKAALGWKQSLTRLKATLTDKLPD